MGFDKKDNREAWVLVYFLFFTDNSKTIGDTKKL